MIPNDESVKRLDQQLALIGQLSTLPWSQGSLMSWTEETRAALELLFGPDSDFVTKFSSISYTVPIFTDDTPDSAFAAAYRRGLEEAKSVLQAARIQVELDWKKAASEKMERAVGTVRRIVNRFHLVVKQLARRYDRRDPVEICDEYDVQDVLHAILRAEFDDIRREEWTPSYAGSSARMDLLLKEEQIVIETKMTRDGLGEKEAGTQLLVDIERYRGHPNCQVLVCFIYDPDGRISNPRGLEYDLSGAREGLEVITVVTPAGL